MVVRGNGMELIFYREDLTDKTMLTKRSKENDRVSHGDTLHETIPGKWSLSQRKCPQHIARNLCIVTRKGCSEENEFTEVQVST